MLLQKAKLCGNQKPMSWIVKMRIHFVKKKLEACTFYPKMSLKVILKMDISFETVLFQIFKNVFSSSLYWFMQRTIFRNNQGDKEKYIEIPVRLFSIICHYHFKVIRTCFVVDMSIFIRYFKHFFFFCFAILKNKLLNFYYQHNTVNT